MGDALSGGVEHEPVGWLEITLHGYGNIAVNYSSGYNGMVDVYLNGVSKHQLYGEKSQDTVNVLFTDGDVIRIAEGSDGKPGILVLNSIDITCGGMFYLATSIVSCQIKCLYVICVFVYMYVCFICLRCYDLGMVL